MFDRKKTQAKTVDFDKPVPRPEEVSEELAALYTRHLAVTAEMRALDARQGEIWRDVMQDKAADDRRTQVDALITGSAYTPPVAARDEMGAIKARRELLNDALHKLDVMIRDEKAKASRLIVAEFSGEQRALATEFYGHVLAAVRVHAKFGEIRQRIDRAGVEPAGLHDFGRDLCGWPNHRFDHAASALRDAVRRGYIEQDDVPEAYR